MKKDFINYTRYVVWNPHLGYMAAQSDAYKKSWTGELERAAYWKRRSEAVLMKNDLLNPQTSTIMTWNEALIQEMMES